MANSNKKKYNTQIDASGNIETVSDSKDKQLEIIERALNTVYPPIIRCILARCEDIAKCWGVGAKWTGDVLGCKSPSKLKEAYRKPEYVSLSKATEIYYINKQKINIIIEALHYFFKILPMRRTSLENLIEELKDCKELIAIMKRDILISKSASKLENSHHKNQYVNFSKAKRNHRITQLKIGIMIAALRYSFKYLPKYRKISGELIEKLKDCKGIVAIEWRS